MKIFRTGSAFDLYGRWNALIAERPNGESLGWAPAHDGDFFPESPIDHVEALRRAVLSGKENGLERVWPVRVDIDISQICNCRCTFCYSGEYNRKAPYRGSVIALEDLSQLLRELADGGTRTIRFTGGGEPLTHPEIKEILRLPHRYGMSCCVLTNGDLIDDELADCIYGHVDHLRWSVNASSDTTREQLHRPPKGTSSLSKTAEVIGHLVRQRETERPGQRRPMIWATFLILPSNFREMIPAVGLLDDCGVDSVSFRPTYHDLGGHWTRAALADAEAILSKVSCLDRPPSFRVFTPKRPLMEAGNLHPEDYFSNCLGRRVRTVLEASREGIALQTCGLYRGSDPVEELTVSKTRSFGEVWRLHQSDANRVSIPLECRVCIDVSMNATLSFMWATLRKHPDALFFRASLSAGEHDIPETV